MCVLYIPEYKYMAVLSLFLKDGLNKRPRWSTWFDILRHHSLIVFIQLIVSYITIYLSYFITLLRSLLLTLAFSMTFLPLSPSPPFL